MLLVGDSAREMLSGQRCGEARVLSSNGTCIAYVDVPTVASNPLSLHQPRLHMRYVTYQLPAVGDAIKAGAEPLDRREPVWQDRLEVAAVVVCAVLLAVLFLTAHTVATLEKSARLVQKPPRHLKVPDVATVTASHVSTAKTMVTAIIAVPVGTLALMVPQYIDGLVVVPVLLLPALLVPPVVATLAVSWAKVNCQYLALSMGRHLQVDSGLTGREKWCFLVLVLTGGAVAIQAGVACWHGRVTRS
jgi:hypothetical protein